MQSEGERRSSCWAWDRDTNLNEMPVCRATSASMTVVASKHKASKHKSAIGKPLYSSKMLHRNVRSFCHKTVAVYADTQPEKVQRKKLTMPHMPSIDRRIYSGLFRKKVFCGKGERWQV